MGLQRAATLYPVNTTVVDAGTGIDIRLLSSTEAGATDASQTITLTHTQDNNTRVFDPATAGGVTTLTQGYALRLSEDMTPDDDARCNALLLAQTLTVSLRVAVNQSGGTYVAGSYGPQWRVIIAAYNPSTNTLVDLSGVISNSATTWNYTPVTGDLGTFKNIVLSVPVPQYEFAPGEVPLLISGLNALTIPNPTLGTATWTFTLAVDDANTFLAFEANKSIRQICRQAMSSAGVGFATKGRITVSKIAKAVGVGAAAADLYMRLAAKVATAAGVASVRKYVRPALAKLSVAVGVASEDNYVRLAAKTATAIGVAGEDNYIRLAAKTAIAVGAAMFSKYVEAFRRFTVTAVGFAGFSRRLIAVRAFAVVAIGFAEITNYVRLAAKTAFGIGVVGTSRMVMRTVSATAIGVASMQRYVRLAAKTAVAFGMAHFARAFIGVRMFVVTAVGVARLFAKISQDIINRMIAGGTTVIRKIYPINYSDD